MAGTKRQTESKGRRQQRAQRGSPPRKPPNSNCSPIMRATSKMEDRRKRRVGSGRESLRLTDGTFYVSTDFGPDKKLEGEKATRW
jgi:hypothetical protein